jgi:TonB family protein
VRMIPLLSIVVLLASGSAVRAADPQAGDAGKAVHAIGEQGVKSPVLVKEVKPVYPDDARAERIQGTVELDGVVETDGSVSGISVKKSLDPRLDEAARKAFAQWQFTAGQKDGQVVRVKVSVELSFTLR